MKRERVTEDDPEVVPLSKRMNNIHFDGRGHNSSHMQQLQQANHSQFSNNSHHQSDHSLLAPPYHNQNNQHQQPNFVKQDPEPSTSQSQQMGSNLGEPSGKDIAYAPVLGRTENPIYFESNRVLFELYRDRLIRNGLPPHPNYCQ